MQGPDHLGRLLLCGATNWDLYNRKTAPKGCKNTAAKNIYTPHRFAPLDDIKVRCVSSGCNAAHTIIISEDYKVYTLGELNLFLELSYLNLSRLIYIDYFLTKNTLDLNICKFLVGRNEKGQLGTGDIETRTQPYLVEALKDINIVNASCGRNHTLLLSGKHVFIFLSLCVIMVIIWLN